MITRLEWSSSEESEGFEEDARRRYSQTAAHQSAIVV